MNASVVLLVCFAVAICEGCHASLQDIDFYRDKREVHRGPRVRQDLSDYFTACMLKKTRAGVIPTMRTVIDFVLRDSKWYEVSEEFFCDFHEKKDTVACWNSVIDLLIDWDSVMLGPARECILAYGKDPRPIEFLGGFRSKRSQSDSSYLLSNFPHFNDLVYESCIELEVNNTEGYPSLMNFDWESIATFAREHISRCRLEKFVQHWDGKIAYKRKCAPYRYQNAKGEKVETAQEQYLPSLLVEVLKEQSPLMLAVTTCNEIFGNATANESTVPNLEEDLLIESSNQADRYRGKQDRTDIIGYCAPESNFTRWYDSFDNQSGDRELLVELQAAYPGEICSRPQGIQSRISRNNQPYYTSGNHLKALSPDVGIECQDLMQDQGKKCENFKVRFCCLDSTSSDENVPENSQLPSTSPSFVKTADTVGICGSGDMWGPWHNIDSQQGDGGDYEYLLQYGAPDCQAVAVQGRTRVWKRPFSETRNNYLTADPNIGIVCLEDMQPKENPCVDIEVRFCCNNAWRGIQHFRYWLF